MIPDNLQYESDCWALGYNRVAGVDEAGRGPLAGPVVVAAVVFPKYFHIEGVNDSKQLTAREREIFFDQIQAGAVAFQVEIIGNEQIDKINILQASLLGMRQAVERLPVAPDFVLIDGNHEAFPKDHAYARRQRALVQGDAKSFTIAAASILAKVTRDRLMTEYDRIFPEYQFAKHKGYPTPEHTLAIRQHGLCSLHRRTFCSALLHEQLGLGI